LRRKRKGLTLVEVMIVALIIGILVSIALPNYMKARSIAQARACVVNMRTIQASVEIWAMATRAKPDDNPPDINDLVNAGYLKVLPRCPAGGTYSINGNVANYEVSCNVHGTLTNAMGSL
jgi:prepilin-type N-terminal cleavage/methylation domain-containing protein